MPITIRKKVTINIVDSVIRNGKLKEEPKLVDKGHYVTIKTKANTVKVLR